MNRDKWGRLAFTSLLGLILSYTFVFLAALPIRYLRLKFGRTMFVVSSLLCFALLASFSLWQWALIYLSVCLLIGLYRELEEKEVPIFLAASLSIILTAGTNLLGFFAFTKVFSLNWHTYLINKASPFVAQLREVPQFKEATVSDILWYLPSGLIVTLMLMLFVSLTMSRVSNSKSLNLQLRGFSLPDPLIWVFIASLATTFIAPQRSFIPVVGANILAVTMAAYFFQGLAVFTHFLNRFRIYGFWRLLAYFLIFFQMFVFISGLGILDYWFDFRSETSNNLKQRPTT